MSGGGTAEHAGQTGARVGIEGRSAWHVYILRCADGTLYTGITTDTQRRVLEHNAGARGAAYTRARRPVVLVWQAPMTDRADASRRECAIKRLSRMDKLSLIGDASSDGT